jgi:DNA polymerase III subunit epsilon
MLFAITDIETTGSAAAGNSITEIGICLMNGTKVVDEFHTLLNPGVSLPKSIVALTGITDDMLEHAPTFAEMADRILEFMGDAIFVAHNVSFDFSFIQAEFAAIGIKWHPKKLCTVKLSRKAFPGNRSYSLGNITRELGIINDSPHRALGDARATSLLMISCLNHLEEGTIEKMLAKAEPEVFLPNHIDRKEFDALPAKPGVYYFQNEKGKPIYIGKAKDIKKRVRSHFGNDKESARFQAFMTEIHHIDFRETANELIATLLEDAEIRKHWPKYNSAQKSKTDKFIIIEYLDQRGYLRLAVNRLQKSTRFIKSFASPVEARNWLAQMALRFEIDLRLLGLDALAPDAQLPETEIHNTKLSRALSVAMNEEPSVLLHSLGRSRDEFAFVWIDKGNLKGFGFVPSTSIFKDLELLEDYVELLPQTEVNSYVIKNYLKNPKGLFRTQVPSHADVSTRMK